MRYLLLLLLIAGPALAQQQAAGSDEGEAAAETAEAPAPARPTQAPPTESGVEYKLVDLLGGKERAIEVQGELVSTLVAANPAWVPYEATLQEWAELYVSWKQMREGMAQVYRDYFSEDELEELLAFYRTDTGRKSIILMPSLLHAGSQVGANLAEEHRTELIEMLRTAGN